jgi:hypothetical protein
MRFAGECKNLKLVLIGMKDFRLDEIFSRYLVCENKLNPLQIR